MIGRNYVQSVRQGLVDHESPHFSSRRERQDISLGIDRLQGVCFDAAHDGHTVTEG